MGRSANYSRESCAVAACLDVIGEPWTLLIIRDAFNGTMRFEQWQDSLGVARNVLAARLRSLTAVGIFEARQYCIRPPRFEYRLTPKGEDLRPLILHMMDWGTRHVYGEARPSGQYVHTPCGHILQPAAHCAHCQAEVVPGDIEYRDTGKGATLADLEKLELYKDLNPTA